MIQGRGATETSQWSVEISEPTHVAEARRRASLAAQRLGFDETRTGTVALVATEAGTNLLKHARNGRLIVRAMAEPAAVEILAVDKGPGMSDVEGCFRDGYSTSGTPGNGLGAIRRLADEFGVFSTPGRGTVMFARVRSALGDEHRRQPVEEGAVCLPIRGEDVPGDAWALQSEGPVSRALVVDGLGHGRLAAEAAAKAVETFRASAGRPLPVVLDDVHGALRASRGAVAAVAELDAGRDQVRFAGIGNIAGVIWAPRPQHMVSMNGTLGHGTVKTREFSYPWPAGAAIVLYSDGLLSRWSLDDYPGLASRHPALVAGVLHRDYCRGNDDVTVVVLKRKEAAWTPPS